MTPAKLHRPAHGGYPDAPARLGVRLQRVVRGLVAAVGADLRRRPRP